MKNTEADSDRLALAGFEDAWRSVLDCPDYHLVETDDRRVFYLHPVDFEMFNGVARNRYDSLDDARRDVRRCKERFAASGLKALWWLDVDSGPPGLDEILVSEGLTRAEDAVLMLADLREPRDPAGPPVDIREAGTESDIDGFVEVFAKSFQVADSAAAVYATAWKWLVRERLGLGRFAVVWEKARPVACCQLILGPKVAGLWGIGTIPERRRNGLGSALTVWGMEQARRAGRRWCMLTASEMGRGIYARAGFRTVAPIRRFRLTPSAA